VGHRLENNHFVSAIKVLTRSEVIYSQLFATTYQSWKHGGVAKMGWIRYDSVT